MPRLRHGDGRFSARAQPPWKKPPRSAAEIGEYALAKEVNWAAGEVPAAEQPLVAVVCPVCHTRLHARLDQVGGTLVCPDCGTSAVVPPPPPPQRKIDPTAEAGEDYRLIDGDKTAAGERRRPRWRF